MFFGEIVEPTSRALWDDEWDEYPDYTPSDLAWSSIFSTPQHIKTLLIADTSCIVDLVKKCCIADQTLKCTLKDNDVYIYDVGTENYIILCNVLNGVTSGEVVQSLSPWLETAQKIYTLTAAPSASFQSVERATRRPCFIRMLSTKLVKDSLYPTLEPPNLLSGVCANVLSYCAHAGLLCDFFVAYLDLMTLDSINSTPILNLLTKLNFPILRPFVFEAKESSSNLYM